ncbi:FliH/SctL family protein [Castellaniella sp.]|uniref:FliH/SctL family protein n=1 Tax=Castellaniella sp. TaxID=1955812 RepID=UPI003565E889
MSDSLRWQPWSLQRLQRGRPIHLADGLDDAGPDAGSGAGSGASAAPRGAAVPSLEHTRQSAQEAGYAEGHAAGLERGREAGHAAGWQAAQAQGYAAGFEEGLEAGRDEGLAHARTQAREALKTQQAQWQLLLASAQAALQHIEYDVGQALAQLAVAMAEQILQHEIRHQACYVQALARRLAQTRAGAEDPTLQLIVHPEDHAALQAILHELTPAVQLMQDASLARGGLLLQTPQGRIDASLQTRWQALLDHLELPSMPGGAGANRSNASMAGEPDPGTP